ncbi:MAG: cysteine synthase A [Prevotella sp.]|nr:cysteine synthase A [Prevotella sp.]
MSQIARNIEGLIGNTPLMELSKTEKALRLKGRVLAKLEFNNPGRSVKDRVALALIEQAEKDGLINRGTTIIEPTSGNTGVGLAMIAASRGYKIILTMPDAMSIERRKLLQALGARLELTPAYEGMPGAIRKAQQLAREIGNAFIPQQFANRANPEAHRKTTAQEILRDTEGKIDIFISGVGTGGTITGVGEVLRQHNPNVQIIAVEPNDSAVLSGHKPGPHKLQGIGAGFVPPVLNTNIYNEIFRVKNEDAFETARVLAEQEGLLVGISSGAAAYAAIEVAKRWENKDKNIVVLLPDTGERYLSTSLFDFEEESE